MQTSQSVTSRALLAIGLLVGFYALAIAIAGGLLYIPYAEWVHLHRLHLKVALGCGGGALIILWSILPRWDRFPAPGPRLEPNQQRRLFQEIESVARATGQTMPSEVFLVGDVNAWVAQRGGVMGFFSRRVMGLGLPLLQTLSVSELRAVLAHEFGHYHAGDTRLGPWIYKTRSAIVRTIEALGDSWINKPFEWYADQFLHITNAVSRRQEFSADALAARVVGARPLIDGLKKVQAAAPAYDAYWSQEVQPVLAGGFLPPIADGFRLFTAHEHVTQSMAAILERAIEESHEDPYETHPPLPARIAAVAELPPGPDPEQHESAISLLEDVHSLERDWLASRIDASRARALQPVNWDEVVERVLLPSWRGKVGRHGAVLGDGNLAELGEVVVQAAERATKLTLEAGTTVSLEARIAFVRWLAATATVVSLDRAGWAIEAPPGAPVVAKRNGTTLAPFEIVEQLVSGQLSADAWKQEARRLAVSELPLAIAS